MDFYIIFAGIIDQGFGNRLVAAINKAGTNGAQKILIFFSSHTACAAGPYFALTIKKASEPSG